MANKIINTDFLSSIATAIRSKLGTSDPISIANMPSSIESIPSGGSGKLPQVIERSVTTLTASDFDNATSVGDYAFYYSTNLENITLGNSITKINSNAFYNCANLKNVIISNSVTSIATKAFYNCASLTNLTFGNSLISLGESSFQNCTDLESVIIPQSVSTINKSAFQGCTKLQTVKVMGRPNLNYVYCLYCGSSEKKVTYYFYSTAAPKINSSSLAPVANVEKIYVPNGYLDAYQSASNWSTYKDLMEEMAKDEYYYEPVEEIINEEDE